MTPWTRSKSASGADTTSAGAASATGARKHPTRTSSSMSEPCPECQQGKHPNCDGTTWNNRTDAPDTCPCHAAGHRKEEPHD